MKIMKDVFCNECGEVIDSTTNGRVDTLRWGEFCSFKCRDAFIDALRAAGIITDLRDGEEPDVIY